MASDPVLLRDEGDITPLRVLSHIEAGDQVIFEGDMCAQPWWPAVADDVMRMLKENESDE